MNSSLLDMADEMTNKMALTDYNENEAEYSYLLLWHWRRDRWADSLWKGRKNHLCPYDGWGRMGMFFSSQYMDDVKFSIISIWSAFYYGASCLMIPQASICRYTYLTGPSSSGQHYRQHVLTNRTFRISEPHATTVPQWAASDDPYCSGLSRWCHMTLSIQTGRKTTFNRDEWEYRNERPF